MPLLGYELSYDTSHAKAGCLGAENNCCKQTLCKFVYAYICIDRQHCFKSGNIPITEIGEMHLNFVTVL